MLNKKQTWLLFFIQVQNKAVETTHNINHAFGLRTVNELRVQWWFSKFCKGDESLEISRPFEVDKTNWEPSWKLILLQLQKKLLKTQHRPFYGYLALESNSKADKSQ